MTTGSCPMLGLLSHTIYQAALPPADNPRNLALYPFPVRTSS